MPRQTDLRYTFEPVGGEVFDVVEFTLSEALSELFVLDVQLSSGNAAVDFGQILDHAAVFTIWRGETAVRRVHGLVSGFTQGTTGFRRTRYQAIVEPVLARAELRSSWRIFQQRSVPEILQHVVKGQRITAYEQHVTAPHVTREYCVQTAETDLEFLARLAAEEGLLYGFTHNAQGHTLIHTDRVQSLGDIEGDAVVYNPTPGGDQAQASVRRFSYTEQVRTAQQTQRDYTFKNPRYSQEHNIEGRALDNQHDDYERYDYPGRYKQDAVGKPFTTTRLNSLRSDARVALVEGDDARIEPGKAFDLTGHPREDWNIRWRAVRVTHQGKQVVSQQEESSDSEKGTYYSQQAQLIPAIADWKAPIPHKPRIDGPQMATVTGPQGEEIYCDEWGRIKVQFPWDRDGRNNEQSSCWIRVSQNWAGAAWGHMAIPRIGQEVIVDFLDGDPDQPIVTGRTYHAANLPPYKLPQHKTRMTIKSQTHKGGGFNELRFEDEKDQEEIYIHAQRNERIHVLNDKEESVDHDEARAVGNDQRFQVGRDRQKRIGQDEELTIGRDRKEHIGQDVFVTIGRNEDRKVLSTQREAITADYIVTVGKNETITIEGVQSIEAKTRLQTLTKEYILQGTDRILIRGPNGKIVLDGSGITLDAAQITLRGSVQVTSPSGAQTQAIQAAIQQGSPLVEECPLKKDN